MRIREHGGPVGSVVRGRFSDQPDPSAASWLSGRSRVTILIHGFATYPGRADDIWARLGADLEARYVGRQDDIVRFYWPGDKTSHQSLARLSYPVQVDKALEAGRKLGEFLAALPLVRDERVGVTFVAHSLGCRVAMEALSLLSSLGVSGRVPIALLMAAAVEEQRFEDGQVYRDIPAGSDIRVLFSRRDVVLRFAFPLGQLASGDSSVVWPQAVGLYGHPSGRWSFRESTSLAHGEYWDSPGVVDRIAEAHGRTTSGPATRNPPYRVPPERPLTCVELFRLRQPYFPPVPGT